MSRFEADGPSASLWYFAYGSNLDPRTFLGRRRMRPSERRRARLLEFRLCFDLPVGRGERGVANVRPAPDAHVWGVAYRITVPEFGHLDRTEGVMATVSSIDRSGVHRGSYRRIPVSLELDDGEPLSAWTYTSERGRPGRRPSERYLGLLLTGARYHRLPADWIETLRALPTAVDERRAQLRLF